MHVLPSGGLTVNFSSEVIWPLRYQARMCKSAVRHYFHAIFDLISISIVGELIFFLIYAFKSKAELVPVSAGFKYIYM